MPKVNIFFLVLAVLFLVMVIQKTIKRKLLERDSLLWILLGLVVIVLGIWPDLIMILANLIGVEYALSLLFLLSTIVMLYLLLRLSPQISQLKAHVRELAQRQGISSSKIQRLQAQDCVSKADKKEERGDQT